MKALSMILTAILAASGAAACTTLPPDVAKPFFPQRASPKPGQDEILLLAAVGGPLTLQGRCLGIGRGDDFSTIVWPGNAELKHDRRGWYVANMDSGKIVRVGETISGGGGHWSPSDEGDLRRYNRYLKRGVPSECAQDVFSLNPQFKAG